MIGLLAVVASLLLSTSPVLAAPAPISIPAGPIALSLRRLSDLTGASIGSVGAIPPLRTRAVRAARTPAEALDAMLAGTGWRAVTVGPTSFRIEREAVRTSLPRATRTLSQDAGPEIVVTALKRPSRLGDVAGTIRILPISDIVGAGVVAGASEVADALPSLTSAGIGPGNSRYFLRGIGDGALGGFNQGSVAVLLDEARINYDAPDPDWALVDVDRVEVLEGPQGPLYGSGALGGIVKIVTTHADLGQNMVRVSAGADVTGSSEFSDRQSIVANLPVVSQRIALRAVGYRAREAGWIDNVGGRRNANSALLTGGRLSLALRPVGEWRVDLTGALQRRNARDSQYLDGTLGGLRRPARLPEPRDSDATLGLATISGRLGTVGVTSVTSLSRQETTADYDATPLAPILDVGTPSLVRDRRRYSVFDQELRFAGTPGGRHEWLAGLSFLQATTDVLIDTADGAGVRRNLLNSRRSVSEAAAFGETAIRLAPRLSLSAGARLFSTLVEDESRGAGTGEQRSTRQFRASGSLGLVWRRSPATTFFLRSATAYRPGGLNIARGATRAAFDADELASLEAGARGRLSPALTYDITLYAERWSHAQADELLASGLVATSNIGNARTLGAEGKLRWLLQPSLALDLSGMIQSARLKSPGQAKVDDPRIPAVPELAIRGALEHGFRMGGWAGKTSLALRYTGATHLSFDPTIDRRAAGRIDASANMTLAREAWTIGVSATNLTDSRADTFPFGNPYRVRAAPQRTPSRPRTVGLTIGRSL